MKMPHPPKKNSTIVPEFLIKHLSFIDEDKKHAAVDMVLIWEAARRSVMEDVMILQGLTAAQAQTTETQLRILREAKSDSKEVARAAAEEAAWRVGQQVQEIVRQAAKPEGPNPMVNMFSQTIQPYFSQALSKVFGMMGGLGAPGGMIPMLAGQSAQAFQSGGQQPTVQPGSKQISNEEMEAAFNDE